MSVFYYYLTILIYNLGDNDKGSLLVCGNLSRNAFEHLNAAKDCTLIVRIVFL